MKNVYEVFEEVEKALTTEEKVTILRKNGNRTVKEVLRGIFDPRIRFCFDRIPAYRPSDAPPGMGYTNLASELDRVYLFVENHPDKSPNLTQERINIILTQILEALEAKEANVLANMLMKKPVHGITKALVKTTFPELFK